MLRRVLPPIEPASRPPRAHARRDRRKRLRCALLSLPGDCPLARDCSHCRGLPSAATSRPARAFLTDPAQPGPCPPRPYKKISWRLTWERPRKLRKCIEMCAFVCTSWAAADTLHHDSGVVESCERCPEGRAMAAQKGFWRNGRDCVAVCRSWRPSRQGRDHLCHGTGSPAMTSAFVHLCAAMSALGRKLGACPKVWTGSAEWPARPAQTPESGHPCGPEGHLASKAALRERGWIFVELGPRSVGFEKGWR
jgi:hypothetical protein